MDLMIGRHSRSLTVQEQVQQMVQVLVPRQARGNFRLAPVPHLEVVWCATHSLRIRLVDLRLHHYDCVDGRVLMN